MKDRKKARLILSNGMEFPGWSFGYEGPSEGEVVFSTAMVGYPESLTDPSYSGQLLCVTYPIVGNYGVPAERFSPEGVSLNFESERIWPKGLIISEYSDQYSHYEAARSLGAWLEEQRIPGIWGVDTRALTKVLRSEGSLLGRILPEGFSPEGSIGDPNGRNLIAEVSCREVIRYGSGAKKAVLVDCGVKHNILRCFLRRNIELVRVPWDYDFNAIPYDGLFISNGPGNPALCPSTVDHIRTAMSLGKPVFGICMGNQLLARAAGAETFKLKFGHRSHNQPVRLVGSEKCFVTSQNHGYAVDEKTLPPDWESWFINMNDGTNEGIRHRSKPFFSVQFHPEASSGPEDTEFLFDQFIGLL